MTHEWSLTGYSKTTECVASETVVPAEMLHRWLAPAEVESLGCIELTPVRARQAGYLLGCDTDTDKQDYFIECYK